jgi:hypothetical protein
MVFSLRLLTEARSTDSLSWLYASSSFAHLLLASYSMPVEKIECHWQELPNSFMESNQRDCLAHLPQSALF